MGFQRVSIHVLVSREKVKFVSFFWDTNLTNWSLQRELRHQLVKSRNSDWPQETMA